MQEGCVMDVLTVFANSDSVFDDHAVVRVYWCTGLHRKRLSILTRYGEAEIAVSKDKSWFPSDKKLLDVPLIHGESLRGIEKIESEGMGMVAVTRHAQERYGEHCGTLDMNTSWKNLHRRLKCRLIEIQLPSRVMLHKLRKHGETPEVWKHPDNPLHYVFCPKNDYRVLVTVFNKDPEEKVIFRPSLANR